MTDDRTTLRPITIGRLVEVTHLCDQKPRTTEDIEELLDVSHRRARSIILESLRISLLKEDEESDSSPRYSTTTVGGEFLSAVQTEAWESVSRVLSVRSPHFSAFVDVLEKIGPATQAEILEQLEHDSKYEKYAYNETSVDVLGDWAERLGTIQRNAFTGSFYLVERETTPSNFPHVLLSVYDELEETTGVNLRQRYLSIPKLRERTCERLQCRRNAFDEALLELVNQNVGLLELSGAPIDTAAKDSPMNIKQISLSEGDTLVSTSQTSEAVMTGVEQYGKRYYYLSVHDRNLTYNPKTE